ncbi:MAG TPA: rhodanese-like domain-containing protein [Saprospiraceae bacterium]
MMLRIRLLILSAVLFTGLATTSCNSKATPESEVSNSNATPTDYADRFLDKETFAKKIKKSDAVVIDVRMPQEFEQSHIEGAINIDFFGPEFKYKLLELKKDKEYYLYCKNETRSKMTMTFMYNNGFEEVYVLKGGYENWNTATAQ